MSLKVVFALLGAGSILLAVQAFYSAALQLYAWEDGERRKRSRAPKEFVPPSVSFTLLLPARHEEEVIAGTLQRMVELNYPPHLVQVLVIIEAGDAGTIAEVRRKISELEAAGYTNVQLLTFADPPINKPHGLNVGLSQATGDVVTIFDAEDGPHPDILQVVNTIVATEDAQVVQCGVQLMNHADHWFSALNVLEYYFWFKSRLHYHASADMVPLGGNTVFVRRELLNRIGGWDAHCLTEDADLGIRLSAAGVPIRLIYEDRYVTREETPPNARAFIKQRTRWDQGFLQVLGKKDWRKLPTLSQRLLALYTLGFPMLQGLMMVYVPLSLYMMLRLKTPVAIAMISTLPLYALVVQLGINLAGLREFVRIHGLKRRRLSGLRMLVAFIPYQVMLAYSALRALARHMLRINTWEKTPHVGAHRLDEAAATRAA